MEQEADEKLLDTNIPATLVGELGFISLLWLKVASSPHVFSGLEIFSNVHFYLPTSPSCRGNELEECRGLISGALWSSFNLPPHQRLKIISPNEGLTSGRCTFQIGQTKLQKDNG